ncbi:MAG: NAD(P)H-dependent oxidoreductase [Capsulimonadaceae bacterium]|nr:NAD(P)H-dependent oxidoreductase [Capsulimonadaceae bacterium]
MKQALIIEVSPRGAESASREVTEALSARLEARFPEARFVRRDLANDTLPHLDIGALKAISSKDPLEAEANKQSAVLSDKLTEELLASDLLVIATPMWNFGIPSLLKAWIDLVVRPGRTFNYAKEGVVGLARNKKAILVLASGGVFTEGPWKAWDFVEPYLRTVLGFIGIEDVQTVRVQGTNMPAHAKSAVPNAVAAVEALSL